MAGSSPAMTKRWTSSAINPLMESPYPKLKTPLTIWAQPDSRDLNARTGMLGHLVSSSRQSPPDFGIASFLREAVRAVQSMRIISQLSEALHKQQPHPQ